MIRKVVAVICLFCLLGCGDSGTKSEEDEYIVSFKLIDAAGNTTTSYKLGEDINFVFSIFNNTGEEQTWTSAYNWPPARFVILQGTDYLGSTYESMPPELTSQGTLNQGEMLQTTASWFDHSRHVPLPVGTYIARAYLNYELGDLQEPPQSWTVEFTVEPPAPGAREVLAWCRSGELGFCPPVNRIYHASVVHNADGSYAMTGTTLIDNSVLTMPCFDAGWTDICFMQIPFGTINLSPQQAAVLEQLLAAFPVEDHDLDPACDPCLINRYYFNGRVEEINPCASGSELYWYTAAEIDTLLHDILIENINPDPKEMAVEFQLTDATGGNTNTFRLGDDINFVLSITNNTGEAQDWSSEYNWPAAQFTVYRGSDYIGSSYEQPPGTPGNWSGVLEDQMTLTADALWSDHSYHAPLAVGEYTARATLNYTFDKLRRPRQWELQFVVEPPSESTTEVFAWYSRPVYCAPLGRVFYAGVLQNLDGSYQLFGATIRVSWQFTAPCFNRGWTDECIGQFPVDDVILTTEQAALMEQLLETFPEEAHIIDETCESCSANIFYINGRWEIINSCASGSDAYWQAVAQLDTLINDLAGVER